MPELSQFKAEFFKALAHPLRIRILDELRRGEVGVNELCVRLAVEQSTLSQQLAVLRTRSIVGGRKDGQNVLYSVRDPEIFKLLDVAKKIFNNHLIDIKDLLSQLAVSSASRGEALFFCERIFKYRNIRYFSFIRWRPSVDTRADSLFSGTSCFASGASCKKQPECGAFWISLQPAAGFRIQPFQVLWCRVPGGFRGNLRSSVS